MVELEKHLRAALATVVAHLDKSELQNVDDHTNVFDLVDSFTVVDLMLETEMLLEAETGRYVTLADENMFDAEKSPLLRWDTWIEYVGACHANS